MSTHGSIYGQVLHSAFKTVCEKCETQWSSVLRQPGDCCEDEPEDGQICRGFIVRDDSKGKP